MSRTLDVNEPAVELTSDAFALMTSHHAVDDVSGLRLHGAAANDSVSVVLPQDFHVKSTAQSVYISVREYCNLN